MRHKDIFRNIADTFRKGDDLEYSVDLAMLMQTHIDKLKEAAFDMQTLKVMPNTVQDAVGIAIHAEKESIRIFTEMYDVFIARFHDVLEDIIDEEKRHLEMLSAVRDDLAEPL